MQLSVVLAVAASVSIIMRVLRQPLIIGYILTGIICGPSLLGIVHDQAAFLSFSQIGIALLLFIVGLGLNVGVIRQTGRPVFLVFLLNTVLVGATTLGVGTLFNLNQLEALLLATAMLFSSTIVVVKALVDDREHHRLHGQIAIGILLVEDIAATIALVALSSAKQGGGAEAMFALAGKGLMMMGSLAFVGWFVLPRLARFFAASQEFLFTFSLAWAFSVAAVFLWAGFSLEVGALFAGVSLASLPYAQEISTRLKPLRDFFLLLFFVSLGGMLSPNTLASSLGLALALSLVVVIIKPLSVAIGLGLLGYTKQTGFRVGAHLSQTSEFSVIMLTLAAANGYVGAELVSTLTLTTFITIAVSSYLMKYDDRLFKVFGRYLSIFERRNALGDHGKHVEYKNILFGYRKGGHEFIRVFRDMHKPYVVVDYDPAVIEMLESQHIHHIYGDVTDYELLQEIGIAHAELVVSVVPGFTTNSQLLKYYLSQNPNGIFICHTTSYDKAAALYELGAAYVLLPHFIGSEKMSAFIRKNGSNKAAFDEYREKHIMRLGKAAIL